MYFTEGQLREYERMMQEKPGFNHEVVKTTVKKDCMHCPVFVSSIIIQYHYGFSYVTLHYRIV